MRDATRELVDKVGNDMVAVAGFRFRYRIEKNNELEKISTLTAWESEADFENHQKGRKLPNLENPAVPFHRYEREMYTVKSAVDAN